MGVVSPDGEGSVAGGKTKQNNNNNKKQTKTLKPSPTTSPDSGASWEREVRDSLEGEDAERPVGLVARVLGHALALEVVGEDAPAEEGAGPHVGDPCARTRPPGRRHSSSSCLCTRSLLRPTAHAPAPLPAPAVKPYSPPQIGRAHV